MDMTIYITDLGAYNQGHLIGEHISLPIDEDNLKSKIDEILSIGAKACGDTEHEEIFITDYDCDFMEVHEYSDPFELNRIAQEAEELNDHELKIVRFLLNNGLVKDFTESLSQIEEVIIHNGTMEDIAFEFVNECYDLDSLPSIISSNISYKNIAHDMELEGRYFEVDGDIYEYLG